MNLQETAITFARLVSTVRNWPVYFSARFGKDRETVYKLRNGMTVHSRGRSIDGMALNDVWLDHTYEPSEHGIPFDWSVCKTIVDVGGNIGTFALYGAYKAPNARIITVEPEPGNVMMIRRNLEANKLSDRVSVVEAGVGPEEGTAQLHIAHKNSGGHSLFHYTDKSHPVSIRITPLTSILRQANITSVDFLKLDCEGGEYDALYLLPEDLLKGIRFIAVEYHHFSKDPRHTPDALKTFLEEKGFTVTKPRKSIFFASRLPVQA